MFPSGNLAYNGSFKGNVAHGRGSTYFDDNRTQIRLNGIFQDGNLKTGLIFSPNGTVKATLWKGKLLDRVEILSMNFTTIQ